MGKQGSALQMSSDATATFAEFFKAHAKTNFNL